MTIRVGASRDAWRAAHGEPLAIERTLVVWADGSVTIDVGDGTLRPLGGVVADYFERRPDALGERFVGTDEVRVDLVATPVPPPGWDEEPTGEVSTDWQRVRNLERRLDEIQGILEPMLASPFVDGPDGRYCFFCLRFVSSKSVA